MTNRAEETEREWRKLNLLRGRPGSQFSAVEPRTFNGPASNLAPENWETETYLPAFSIQEVVDELVDEAVERARKSEGADGSIIEHGESLGLLTAVRLLRERCLGGEEG